MCHPPDLPDEPEPLEGCTLGYWKQDHHFDSWVGYSPDDSFDTVFGVDSSFATLLDALEAGGAGEAGMARQAVAALLNAASPDVIYPMTEGEIIDTVRAAYAAYVALGPDPTNAQVNAVFDSAHTLLESYNVIVTTYPDGTVNHCPLD